MKKQLLSFLRTFWVKAKPAFLSKINNLKFLTPVGFRTIALLLLFMPCLTKAQYVSDKTNNLNFVYFIPTDNPPVPDYERRLSGIMLWLQDYYGKEMERNGYGYKTFGLLKDDVTKRVKITLIQGKLGKINYGYDGGSGNVKSEVDAYFAAHPSEKQGEHFLIILPDNNKSDTNPDGVGAPFYGLGKYCFAKDLPALDMANAGQAEFVKYFGGLAHELGHGLNLPHNCQKVSENATLGMALMWAGNGTLTKSKTFLTATDCAILNVNQIFNTGTKNYYGATNASIKRIHANYSRDKGSIVVSGKFATDTPVTSVVFYNDPNSHDANMVYEGTGVNHDYNAVTWETKTVGVDSFYVEMPIAELTLKDDATPYELKVKLVHDNGNVKETIYSYNFVNGIPVLNFSTKDEISKAKWSIVASSEQTTAPATKIIDNDLATAWHSQYSTPPAATYPHTVTINLGQLETLYGFTIANTFGRAIKNAELLYSVDGVNFTSLGDFVIPKSRSSQDFVSGPLSFQYFKVIAKSSWDGNQFAQIDEMGFYAEQDMAPTVAITSPTNNASFLPNSNITITANASDSGGRVSKVEFFNGATKLGEDLTAPYSYNWTNVPSGQYNITAKVTDNSGLTIVSEEVTFSVKVVDYLLPVADSYVRDGASAAMNFGTAATLTVKKDGVGYSRIAYLKFNLSEYQTDTFDVGKLKLAIQAAGIGSPLADYQLWYCANDSWMETSLTWNNKPALTTLLATQKGKIAGSIMEWDIKDRLKTEINGDKTLTLALVSTTLGGTYDMSMYSKEAVVGTALKPQIIAQDLPKISLISPSEGAVVNQGIALAISANATDDKGVENVKFFIDGVEKATVTTAPYSWNATNLDRGSYVVTARVTDVSGFTTDTAPVTVIVKDLTAPVISCPANIVVNNDENQCGAVVSFAATATDNFSDVSVRYSQDPATVFPIGITTVTATATDADANSSICSFTITVEDNTAPSIVCPENIVLSACEDTAIWSAPVASDNCTELVITQIEGPESGATFENGTTTTISYEVKDKSGNTNNCSFTVTRKSELDIMVSNSNPQLYYGYAADQSSIITGTPLGGVAPYTISISMDRPLKCNVTTSAGDEIWNAGTNTSSSSNITCPQSNSITQNPISTSASNLNGGNAYGITVSLMETALFTITVTDANGCSVSKTTTVNAEDVRCFAGNNTKVKICHNSGNGKDSCKELCVSEAAVAAHLSHGDSLGTCSSACASGTAARLDLAITEASVFDVKVYPNPAVSQFTLVLEGGSNENVEVLVYDMLARKMKQITKKAGEPIVFGEDFISGQYLAMVKQGNEVKIINLLKK